jgi:hypothetical protein
MLSGIFPGGQIGPSSPIARATVAAVAGASPVIMTVRTPKDSNSTSSARESARGGSPNAISPMKASLRWSTRHPEGAVSGGGQPLQLGIDFTGHRRNGRNRRRRSLACATSPSRAS